jgi:hypothetical protein
VPLWRKDINSQARQSREGEAAIPGIVVAAKVNRNFVGLVHGAVGDSGYDRKGTGMGIVRVRIALDELEEPAAVGWTGGRNVAINQEAIQTLVKRRDLVGGFQQNVQCAGLLNGTGAGDGNRGKKQLGGLAIGGPAVGIYSTRIGLKD